VFSRLLRRPHFDRSANIRTDHAQVDTGADGEGKITEHRLFQLIRQKGTIQDRTFEIEFLEAGAQAFAFTFG